MKKHKSGSAPCGLLGGRAASAYTALRFGRRTRNHGPATAQRPAPRTTSPAINGPTGISTWFNRATAIVRCAILQVIYEEHGGGF